MREDARASSSSKMAPGRAALLGVAAFGLGAVAVHLYRQYNGRKRKRVLVVGSINVDLYQRTQKSAVKFAGKSVDITAIKGMTLPASSFVANPKVPPPSTPTPSDPCRGDPRHPPPPASRLRFLLRGRLHPRRAL